MQATNTRVHRLDVWHHTNTTLADLPGKYVYLLDLRPRNYCSVKSVQFSLLTPVSTRIRSNSSSSFAVDAKFRSIYHPKWHGLCARARMSADEVFDRSKNICRYSMATRLVTGSSSESRVALCFVWLVSRTWMVDLFGNTHEWHHSYSSIFFNHSKILILRSCIPQ